jgi:PAS domain S-box-containing protein
LADVLNIAFEKLSDERARLDLALSSAKMGWWEWDVANDKHYWSPEFERLLGVPGGFAGGLEAFLERVHPEDSKRVRKLVYDTLDSKRPPRFTYRVLDENGRVRYLSSRAQVYQNPAGQIIRLVGIDSDVTEAHLAQQQLRESEENLRYTLELNPQIPWSADPQGNLLDFSERWPRLVGRTRDELLRDGWAQLSPPEDRVLVQAAWRRALVSGEPYDVEHRIKLADGSLRWVHSRAFPRCDEAGQIVRWYGTTEDISERKEIEERLREREARLRLALQNSAITLAGMDRELRYTWIHNPHPDFKEQEVIGKRDDELLPEEVAKQFVVVKRRALETGSAQRTEISVPLSDGLHSYDFLVEPTRDASGNILGLTSASFDISERKRAEEALRVSEERLSLALDGGQIGTFDWDIQSNSIYWSPNIEAFMGMTSGEFEQTFEGFIKRVYPDDQARVQEQIAAALVTGDYQCEFRMMRKDGTVRWVMARGRVFFSEAKQPKRMVGVDVDVTERKAMETALREADRRKDEFLAVLAHELRNPLAPIRTGLEVMKLSDDPGLQQEAKAIIERQTTQLVHLVDDLLDVSRFARGKVRLNKEPLTIHEVVDMAVESASPLLEDRSHVLKISLPTAPIQIEGDKTRLCQIILNLLTNAAKYTPPGGTITLSVEASGDECVVTVQDTGIGLPKTMLTKVFDMFTRVEREESYQQQGLGIGLSLVKQFALLHGGTVTAESPGEGQGSTFTLRLPIFQGTHVKASKDAFISQAATSRSRRVLVVDDYEANLKTLSKMLQLMGHEVETAENGERALERLKTFKADLVFLDINMPGMDGYEVARHIRADKAQQDVKVIALTGYGQPEDVERATKAGFDAHLVKPVELERLNGILNM